MGTELQIGAESGTCVFLVMVGDFPGRTYALRPMMVIGRDHRADVHIDHPDILPEHARVCRSPRGGYDITAFGLGGLKVNGAPVSKRRLHPGDRVAVGPGTLFVFCDAAEADERAMTIQRLATAGRFAGGIAHDLNNLLGAVLGNLGHIRRQVECDGMHNGALRPAVDDAEFAIRRITELTGRLVGLADRTHADQPIDMGRVVRDVADQITREERTGLIVDVAASVEAWVRADAAAMHAALLALCANAREAMPNGGVMRLAVRMEASGRPRVFVEVSDTGRGMTLLTQQRAFEPDFTTKPGRGTGLGLALVERVVREHGGEVTLTSRRDRGTRVQLELPRIWAHVAQGTVHGLPEPQVLLIDGDDLFRRSTRRALQAVGLTVVDEGEGARALQRFAADPDAVGLVMLDVLMVDMPTEVVFRRLKAIRSGVRVVLLTGTSRGDDMASLMALGACDVLNKQSHPEDLKRAVLQAMGAED